MKRFFALFMAALMLFSLAGCGSGKNDTTEVPVTEKETAPAGSVILPDFTVKTIDGGSFSLSEALKDHELVLINLFFTNCPPCKMEFPFLQQAWEQNSDRVAVIALSPDPEDTDEVLKSYVEELGLTFPVAHEEGAGLYPRYVTTGFPTSLLVDRTGRIALSQCGAMAGTEDFLKLFDSYTGEDYDTGTCRYVVRCYDAGCDDQIVGVEGVAVNFCTDKLCVPVTSNAAGEAVYEGLPEEYHVEIVKIPDSWKLAQEEAEWTTEPFGELYWVALLEVSE